ncbi:hypothetical protein [Pseudoxanthomonas gei]|uniref:hypothetical protein n=1 Tax=Pseudoxanthomonas gei TaxID=1383030 RepID=UPI0013918203|nr:hypothetical protein [Pseudoxanthomonas gei]
MERVIDVDSSVRSAVDGEKSVIDAAFFPSYDEKSASDGAFFIATQRQKRLARRKKRRA